MLFVGSFCLLLMSDSASRVIAAESPRVSSSVASKRFPSQSCFSSPPITHFICPLEKGKASPITLTFIYSCKWKPQEIRWFKVADSSNASTPLAERIADGPLTIKGPGFDPRELESVEGCSTCLQFKKPELPGRDEGWYFVKVVSDKAQEVTSRRIRIDAYDPKSCPRVDNDPLTITVNSRPLKNGASVTVDDIVELEFLLPVADPVPTAAVYVAQEDLTYVRFQVRHTCDPKTRRCGAKVKMSNRLVPKVFQRDEKGMNIRIFVLFRYMQMKPIEFRRDLTLMNPNFNDGHS